MPTWTPPASEAVKTAVDQTLEELSKPDVDLNQVVGMEAGELATHAIHAIKAFNMGPEQWSNPIEAMVKIYCFGFVVGTRYGQNGARDGQ